MSSGRNYRGDNGSSGCCVEMRPPAGVNTVHVPSFANEVFSPANRRALFLVAGSSHGLLLKTMKAVICLLLACAQWLSAAEPALTRQDLFVAGENGYAMYRIPGLVATPGGALLAYCEARKSSGSDWGQIDVVMRRSTDGGTTWSPMRTIAAAPADARRNEAAAAQDLGDNEGLTVNNPVAVVDRESGVVHFLYCVEYARCFYLRSEDDGATWSEPVEITQAFEGFSQRFPWRVIATGPGHGIQLRNGRLIVPVWLSTGTGGHAHRPSVNSVIFSDDAGDTWRAGEIAAGEFNPLNPSETAVVQLADGRVMLNFRHESPGRGRGVTVSPDGVGDWSPVQYDAALSEPICMAGLHRLSTVKDSDRNRLLFSNPNNPLDRRRRNLTIRLSYDEGVSWPVGKTLEPRFSAYSDLAVGPDGSIHCFFERGSDENPDASYATLTLATFNLEWLTEGLDTMAPER